jgi:ankyrin repeat protein
MNKKLLQAQFMKECQQWRPNTEKIKEFLDLGASVNEKDIYGNTPFNSIILKKPLIVKLFIDSGANIYTKNNELLTPLHTAASHHDTLYAINLLIDLGLNLNEMEKHQMTPLHYAALSGCLENVKLLVRRGANTKAIEIDKFNPYQLAKTYQRMDVANYLFQYEIEQEKNLLESNLSNEINNKNKIKL